MSEPNLDELLKHSEEMRVPLNLTSGQQSVLADMCSLSRKVIYRNDSGSPMSDEEVGLEFYNILGRYFSFTPQSFDAMYDKLHRTGSNS